MNAWLHKDPCYYFLSLEGKINAVKEFQEWGLYVG